MGRYLSEEDPLAYPVLLKDGTCIGYVQIIPVDDGTREIGPYQGEERNICKFKFFL